jgi:mono/diheme cytochrome c family protein
MRPIGVVMGIAMVLALAVGGLALAAGDAAKGRATFQQLCSGCHGPAGKGDGAMGAALNPKPKDFSNKAYNGSLKTDYLVKIIKGGGQAVGKSPMMPNVGSTLKDTEVADLVAYIRFLAK